MEAKWTRATGILALAGFLATAPAGCTTDDGYGIMGRPGWGKTETGAVIGGVTGAAAGAAIGKQSENTGKGALIGGATGALIGGAIGRQMERRDIERDYRRGYDRYYDGYGY